MAYEQTKANQYKAEHVPKGSRPMMKQHLFYQDTEDKYNQLKNFKLEVNNVFKTVTMPDIGKIAIIKLAR